MAIILEDMGDAPRAISSSYRMTTSDQFFGLLDNSYGEDWIGIELIAGQSVTITLVGDADYFDGALNDPYLYLYDSEGAWIAQNDDGGPGLTSRLVRTVGETGLYFIGAAGYGGQTGSYRLDVVSPFSLTGEDDLYIADGSETAIDALSGDDTVIGSDSDETIRGNAGNDSLEGNGGNDSLAGFDGDDTLLGGDGDDSLNAGRGNDLLDGGAGNDALYGGRNADNSTLLGGDGDDTLTGGIGQTRIEGGAGDDLIFSGSGTTWIDGGDGDDEIDSYGTGDVVHGGGGNDFIDTWGDNGTYFGGDGDDLIYSYGRNAILTGGAGNDTLWIFGDVSVARGGDGNDTLHGNWTDDTLTGGNGADEIYGNAGRDTADYSGAVQRAVVDLADQSLNAGAALGDLLHNIEILQGTAQGDSLGGNDYRNDLLGWLGDDLLDGRGGRDLLDGWIGDDTLIGGAGNDTLIGGAGADSLDGGNGIDIALYDASIEGVRLDLTGASMNAGAAAGDVLTSIENILGSDLADTIGGDGADNRFMGLAGNDSLSGLDGDDTLIGGFGNDTMFGGSGADLILGGTGRDVASYAGAGDGVVLDMMDASLNTGDAAGDILVSIEAIRGTIHDDALFANEHANALQGYAGDDTLNGRGGNDRIDGGRGNDQIEGGAGADILTGGAGEDAFVFAAGDGQDVITDFQLEADALVFFDTSVSDVSQLGGNTVITYGDAQSITLSGVLATEADLMLQFVATDPMI